MISNAFKKYIVSEIYKYQFNNSDDKKTEIKDNFINTYNNEKRDLLFKMDISKTYKIRFPNFYVNFYIWLEIDKNILEKYTENYKINIRFYYENFNKFLNNINKNEYYSKYLEDIYD